MLANRFGDRVKHFFTINEPQNFIGQGYQSALHPPFVSNLSEMLLASHHALLANGLAVRALRSYVGPCKIGMAPVGNVKMPLTENDVDFTYNEMFRFNGHTFNNSWFSDPVFLGHYPEDCVKGFRFEYADKDLYTIKCDMDFYGVNIYTGRYVTQNERGGGGVSATFSKHAEKQSELEYLSRGDVLGGQNICIKDTGFPL